MAKQTPLLPPPTKSHAQSQSSSPRSAGGRPKLMFSFASDDDEQKTPDNGPFKNFSIPALDQCSPAGTALSTTPFPLSLSGPIEETNLQPTASESSRQSQVHSHRQSAESDSDNDGTYSESPRQTASPGFIPQQRSKTQPRSRTSPNLLEEVGLRRGVASPHHRFMPSALPLSNPSRSQTTFVYPSPHLNMAATPTNEQKPWSPMQGRYSYHDLDAMLGNAFSPSTSGGRTSKFATRRTIPKRREPILSTTKETTPRRTSPRPRAFNRRTKKPPASEKFLQEILSESPLFQGIVADEVVDEAIRESIHEMYTRDVKKGEVIIEQGDPGDAFFVCETGEFDIIVEQVAATNDPEKMEKVVVGKITSGQTVGETALLYATKRSATIKATENSRVWVMEASQFHHIRELIRDLTKKKLKMNQDFLSTIPIFAKLKQHELMNLAQASREVKFKPGDTIVDKKKRVETDLFIIREGKGWVVRDRRNSIAICQDSEISEGDFFMRKMMNNDPLNSVKCTEAMQCLKISKDDFDMLVAPHLNEEEGNSDEEEKEVSQTSTDQELPKDTANRVPYKLQDFHPFTIAGVGSFGHVVLVKVNRDTDDEKVYALKVVEKNKAINTGQSEHMKNERRVMFLLNSPFIVKLYGTYQDDTCVYFLLEKVLGGELFSLLRRYSTFNEPTARFYLGCVILAFEHMHGHNIIYRDLKPENLLIDKKGFVKLTDFGFAKKRNQTTSLCGTPDYLAPELIQGLIQNFGVDWWCLGVFCYEMLVGRVPFRDTDSQKMYEHILHSRAQVPTFVDVEAQDLIHKLLEKNSYRRLGSGPKGAKDIRAHQWFEKDYTNAPGIKVKLEFCWDKLENLTHKTPFVPELSGDDDARHFTCDPPLHEETPLSEAFRDDPDIYEWCEEF